MELKFWNFHSQKWFIHKFPVSEFRWIIHKYAHRAKNNIFNFNFSYFLDPFPVKVKTVVRQWSFPEFSTTFQGILKQAGTGAVSMTKSVHLLSSKWSLREGVIAGLGDVATTNHLPLPNWSIQGKHWRWWITFKIQLQGKTTQAA